jgi:hypothetical protein
MGDEWLKLSRSDSDCLVQVLVSRGCDPRRTETVELYGTREKNICMIVTVA